MLVAQSLQTYSLTALKYTCVTMVKRSRDSVFPSLIKPTKRKVRNVLVIFKLTQT